MCTSCGCLLPANPHDDSANITHSDFMESGGLRGLTLQQLEAAAHTRVGPGNAQAVINNIMKTEGLIAKGRLDPNRR